MKEREGCRLSSKICSFPLHVSFHSRGQEIGCPTKVRTYFTCCCCTKCSLPSLQCFYTKKARNKRASNKTCKVCSTFVLLIILAQIIIIRRDPLASISSFILFFFRVKDIGDSNTRVIKGIQARGNRDSKERRSIPKSLCHIIQKGIILCSYIMSRRSLQIVGSFIEVHLTSPY
ncbi:hypothetical protein D9M71_456420 [compost metagenome]